MPEIKQFQRIYYIARAPEPQRTACAMVAGQTNQYSEATFTTSVAPNMPRDASKLASPAVHCLHYTLWSQTIYGAWAKLLCKVDFLST